MSSKWKSSLPMAGVVAAAALAFPGIASAAVVAEIDAGVLTVTGDGADAITISCDAGGDVAVADNTTPFPARRIAPTSPRSTSRAATART